MRVFVCSVLAASLLAACGPELEYLAAPPQAQRDAGFDGPVMFSRDIRPLMDRADGPNSFGCKRCHYPGEPDPQGLQLGGLDLSSLGALRRGGISSGQSIVVPGDPDASAIVQKLEGRYVRGARMPKDRTPWSVAEIALVRRWIQEGAQGTDQE